MAITIRQIIKLLKHLGMLFFLGIESAMNWVLEHMGDPGMMSCN